MAATTGTVSGPVVIQDQNPRIGQSSSVGDECGRDFVDHRLRADASLGQRLAKRRRPKLSPDDRVARAELKEAVELRTDAAKMHPDVAHFGPLHVHGLASISLPSLQFQGSRYGRRG